MDQLKLCVDISDAIKTHLYQQICEQGYNGEQLDDPTDLKSTHLIDKTSALIANQLLSDFNCNIFIESVNNTINKHADFSVYIDPVDGSMNWQRGVGDPAVVIAISNKPIINTLNDLNFAFVFGLRSLDVYYSDGKQAYYISNISKQLVKIKCTGNRSVAEATAYFRTGYSAAQKQLDFSLKLYAKVRDVRAFDNTAIEMCEIARNAADVMIEARDISDFFNLLSYPILNTAGGSLTDLSGNDLGNQIIEFDSIYNFIACNNSALLNDVIKLVK